MLPRTAAGRIIKSVTPMVLVLVFLYNICGYFVVFQVNRAKVRSEMRQQLAASERKIHILRIFEPENDPSFRRIHAKEFVYKGQMFDVLKEARQEHITEFHCIRDIKEELLVAGLRKAAGSKEAQNLVHHLITLAMPVAFSKEFPRPACNISYQRISDPLADRPHAPSPPPPEVG